MPTKFVMFFEEITKWVDLYVIYLDFKKAFDKVPHQRLILKLKQHGMGNSIINWIEQWLTDRKQRVVVDREVSSWMSVLGGVPQGSVIGPILFLVLKLQMILNSSEKLRKLEINNIYKMTLIN